MTTNAESGAERRKEPRIPLHLNVILLQEGHRPRGCRVLNVSQGGMFLEWSAASKESQSAAEQFSRGDAITILCSFRTEKGRQTLELPAKVMRTEGKGIGIAFDDPQPVIAEIAESYADQWPAAEPDREEEDTATPRDLGPSAPEGRRADKDLLDVLEGLADPSALPDIDDEMPAQTAPFDFNDHEGDEILSEERLDAIETALNLYHGETRRRLTRLGRLGLLVALVLAGANIAGYLLVQDQLQGVRHALPRQAAPVAAAPSAALEPLLHRLENMERRLDQVAPPLSRLEERMAGLERTLADIRTLPAASPSPAETAASEPETAARTPAPTSPEAQKTSAEPAPETPATTELPATTIPPASAEVPTIPEQPTASETPLTAKKQALTTPGNRLQDGSGEAPASEEGAEAPSHQSPKGPWIINLLALKREQGARAFAEKAERLGIPVEVSRSEGRNGILWRLRVTGLPSAAEARAYAREIAPRLGLENTWISRMRP